MRYVESKIDIQASPENVINAILEPNALSEWWGVERALTEKRQGGSYTLAWKYSDTGVKYVSTGVITTYEPSRCLQIDNFAYICPDRPILGPMSLRIDVRPSPLGTFLTLRQSGYQDGADWDWYHAAVTEAWPMALTSLKMFLEK